MNIEEVIDATIARVCHDLIGPIGTALMALEQGENKILGTCLEQAVDKLDLLRSVLRANIKNDVACALIKKHIEKNGLKLELQCGCELPGLLLFICQKFSSKSSATVKENEIYLKNFFLSQEEQDALLGVATHTSPGNIFPYIAYLNFRKSHKLKIDNLGEKNWKITIKKI